MSAAHERLERDDVQMGSERSFGIVFAVVFAVIGLFPLIGSAQPRWWALAVAAAFLALALVYPALLRPLNRVWFRFGLLLHKITNPVVMGLMFFGTITPVALIMRIAGKDPLRLKLDRAATSYWIERDPPGPAPDSMDRQF
jgi:predicted membrane metal-binding protein